MTALEQAIASGQVSPAQIEAHRTAGELKDDKTGWPSPKLMQDDDRGLSKWLSSKPDARQCVREALNPQTLREICDGAPADAKTVSVSIADLRAALDAGQAVLDRWNSPKWEWHKNGPTADLMADLYAAIKATS